MHSLVKTFVLVLTLVTGVAAISALYADESHRSRGSTKDREGMMRGSMMNMADQCGQMMQGMTNSPSSQRPNDQWWRTPSTPEEKL